ncbi:hypothetical protein CDAR_547181 [Caerostris darwini]|uniref:Uncharacterized protein n=1 Tax=Caerostris darwini TaxID=1538125 RepID=A0AAV4WTW7_9ARAC|nr:hypothetical protein CDAR_547181 [Caerostris darwini]
MGSQSARRECTHSNGQKAHKNFCHVNYNSPMSPKIQVAAGRTKADLWEPFIFWEGKPRKAKALYHVSLLSSNQNGVTQSNLPRLPLRNHRKEPCSVMSGIRQATKRQ